MYAGNTSKNKQRLTARKCFHRLLQTTQQGFILQVRFQCQNKNRLTAVCRHIRCLLKALTCWKEFLLHLRTAPFPACTPTTHTVWKIPSRLNFAIFNAKTKIMGKKFTYSNCHNGSTQQLDKLSTWNTRCFRWKSIKIKKSNIHEAVHFST